MRSTLRRISVAAVAAMAALTAALPGTATAQGGQEQQGRTYYVATSGSDRDSGSARHPLRTIGRCTDLVRPGDTCLIHRGTYRERVAPPSGRAGAPVTLAAYGDGPVTVDGTRTVTGWKDAGGGLVATDVDLPLARDENALFLDGGRAMEGRWPNSGSDPLNPSWAVAERSSTDQHIDDPDLPDGDLTGATVHLWAGSNPWSQQTGTVTATSDGALDFKGGNYRCTPLCMGDQNYRNYYLVGAKATLDQPGEWYYDTGEKRLYLVPPKGGMAGHTVTAKYEKWGLDLIESSHVTVRGLGVWGTSLRTGEKSTGVLVEGLRARYISEFSTLPMPRDDELAIPPGEGHIVASRVLDSGVQILGTGNTLRDSDIGLSAGTGVLLRGSGNTITNNYIHDVGWMGSYTPGIEINGSGHTVTHNTVRRTGRASIDTAWQLNGVPFKDNRIAYNDLSEAMRTSRDGSPFYVCCNLDATGTSVDHNTVHDADGQVGYYIDNSSSQFLLHHNVAYNTGTRGTFFNGHSGVSLGNRDHNSTYGAGVSTAVRLSGATDATGTYVSNDVALAPMEISGPGDPAPVVRNNLLPPADPRYTDARNGELWPRAGSPAIDAGETVDGVTTGVRGDGPDQGAYEYGAPIWSTGCNLAGCESRVRNDGWKATFSGGGDASAAVDGVQTTQWKADTNQAAGQSLTLDLGAAKTFSRLAVDAGLDATGHPYGFTVSVSRDGRDWGAPVARVAGRSFTQDAVFGQRTARYVRIELTAAGDVPWAVNEVRLYADGPDAAGTLQAERAQVVRGGERGDAATGVLGSGGLVGFRQVSFGADSPDRLTVRMASAGCGSGCALQLRLDDPKGRVVATLPVRDTGGADQWQERSVRLARAVTGTHDVYLVATGARKVAAVDWLTLRD
ncbi:carbohydrate-binding protein [Streptomyces botrytidirepellens]|uniref:Carbohydrate-binding protein n=1 Tax=Streptomyces botrytidirepellens TaxID=2486417 RepID=A0A3M8VJW8_9ACTN|nr:carbohydrate-binding protein [Streptomyces botrytidirepellens]RNG17876.1 carbohydrate-binding protein [Streptomyces botrytidirepellens]